ncbi:MAG TPA: hypothetical protein VLE02_02795 [Nitrosarchaeum sp.]|nr:hypothetical protein [Nitrosarchaeum sp.]
MINATIINSEEKNVHAREKVNLENKPYRALTNDSKSLKDFKEVKPSKTFNDIANKGTHTDFFCKLHMKDRLLNYCNQDSLVDVIMSGITSLHFSTVDKNFINQKCKSCQDIAEYRIDRID